MSSKDKGLSTGSYREHLINFKDRDAERNGMIDVGEQFLAALFATGCQSSW